MNKIKKYLKNYSMKDTVNLILETENINKKKIYDLCLKIKNEKNYSLIFALLLIGCSTATQFGTGVNITFDPRTIGMQIDDTIMQKNLSARLALADKKYFLSIQSEVIDGRIFLSGKVDEPEEKIKDYKNGMGNKWCSICKKCNHYKRTKQF